MARTIPACPPAPEERPPGESRSWKIDLVTPLFGGGTAAGDNDPITLVRGASIRGQLRFWWRAARGARFESPGQLKEAEDAIWGTTDKASRVRIRVELLHSGNRNKAGSLVNQVPYALFPWREQKNAQVSKGASFRLVLSWPTDEQLATDIEAALWAWTNFGGLGARTRRGGGALFCKELAPTKPEGIQKWYEEKLKQHGIAPLDKPRAWPTLPDKLWIKPHTMNPEKAWKEVVELLSTFRQGKGVGRNPGGKFPGRSRWPEADSIRRITGRGNPKHEKSITTRDDAFPRAEFGLPIVFHFKDAQEPPDCTLLPSGDLDRMASPLVLKPLALAENQAVPMILKLCTQPLKAARLEKGRHELCALSTPQIRRPDLAHYTNSPMQGRTSTGSALEAFVKFAEEEGFK